MEQINHPISNKRKRQLAAIMFTDIVGFSSMMQTDEESTIIKVNRHRTILEKYTQQFKGRILQYYGDASLTIYDSAIDAVQCAIAMQAAYQQAPKIPLRIGIHLGEVVFDKDDIYGDAINIANRIESIGVSNSILLSGKVQEELKNHPELVSKKIGDYNFKNIDTPIPVFALDLQGLAIPKANTNSSKAFSKPQKNLIQKIGIPLLSICLSLLATIAAFKPQWLSFIKPEASSIPLNETVTEKRIAVLNFENGTGLKEMDILSRVSSDWITQGLMETGTAKIITTRAIEQHFDYQQASINPAQAITSFTQKTGAQSTIEGSFFIQKDSIFFLAKIINLHSGEILLSFPPQKSHKDQPLVALEKIKQRICGYWIIKEDKNLLTLTPPIYDAYKEYLIAKEFWSNDYSKALIHLDRSIALDSSFLLANFLKVSLLQNTKRIVEAKNLVSKIKKTHPRLNPHYRNYLNFYEFDLYGNNQNAIKAFKKIYNVYKEDVFSNTSMAVMYLDYKNNAKKTLEVLAQVDPKNIDYENCTYCLTRMHLQARALIKLGKYDQALEVIRSTPNYETNRMSREIEIRALARMGKGATLEILLDAIDQNRLDKDFRYLFYTAAREFQLIGNQEWYKKFGNKCLSLYLDDRFPRKEKMLARVYYLLQRYDEALSLIEKKPPHKQTVFATAQRGAIFAYQGKTEKIDEILARLESRKREKTYGYVPYHQARVCAIAGQKEKAISYLKQSLQEGRKFWPYLFENDPDFKNLLEEEEFHDLIHP